MQMILSEQEYADLKELADKSENYKNLYNDEKLKTRVYQYQTNKIGHGKC